MRKISCLAPAKINLALHVTAERPDGYHEIDTLVAFCDLADRIWVSPTTGSEDQLNISGPFAAEAPAGADNLVLQAANALRKADRVEPGTPTCPPASIKLEKNLPVAAGIGGGSADAAAALLALETAWQTESTHDLDAISLRLGADVPMCLRSRPLRAKGVGEKIETLSLDSDWPVLLVNPGIAVPTGPVFAALGRSERLATEISNIDAELAIGDLTGLRNDLEAPAILLQPVISDVLEALRALPNCRLARMSGSGATCFALFHSRHDAKAASNMLAEARPDWWQHCGVLYSGPIAGRLVEGEDA